MRRRRTEALLLLALLCPVEVWAAVFTPLGRINASKFYSEANDVSADGNWVVGSAITGDEQREAFRWSRTTGGERLGDLPKGLTYSVASGVSDDGGVIGGLGSDRGDSVFLDGFRWTASAGMEPVGFLSQESSLPYSYALDVSSDGRIVVGTSGTLRGNEAFRWTPENGMEGLGDLPGGPYESFGETISNDGRVIAGSSKTEIALEAFRWTAETGMQSLGFLPGFALESHARKTSPDGSIIIGTSANEGWYWTAATGMVNIGHLPSLGGWSVTIPCGLTAEGSTIVGSASNNDAEIAFIWDPAHGMRNLQDVLESEQNLQIPGWTLTSANGISSGGSVIVGRGRNPFGETEAWVIDLRIPEPPTIWQFGGCLLALLATANRWRLHCRIPRNAVVVTGPHAAEEIRASRPVLQFKN